MQKTALAAAGLSYAIFMIHSPAAMASVVQWQLGLANGACSLVDGDGSVITNSPPSTSYQVVENKNKVILKCQSKQLTPPKSAALTYNQGTLIWRCGINGRLAQTYHGVVSQGGNGTLICEYTKPVTP